MTTDHPAPNFQVGELKWRAGYRIVHIEHDTTFILKIGSQERPNLVM